MPEEVSDLWALRWLGDGWRCAETGPDAVVKLSRAGMTRRSEQMDMIQDEGVRFGLNRGADSEYDGVLLRSIRGISGSTVRFDGTVKSRKNRPRSEESVGDSRSLRVECLVGVRVSCGNESNGKCRCMSQSRTL